MDQALARQSHVPLSYSSSGHDLSHPRIISESCKGKVHNSYREAAKQSWITPGAKAHKRCRVVPTAHPVHGGESKFMAQNLGKTPAIEDDCRVPYLQMNHCSATQRSYLQITHFLFFFLTRRFWLVQKRL